MAKVNKSLSIEPRLRDSIELGFGTRRQKVFLKWQANSPSSEITRSKAFWNVWSNVTEETMLKFLRLRIFWGLANDFEKEFSFSHPRILNDLQFNVLLTALATTELGRKELAERLKRFLNFIGHKFDFHEDLLKQWENHIKISGATSFGPIGKHKAFSGWVRNSSSVGSKRSVKSSTPEPLSEEFTEDKFDEFEFLLKAISVGSFESNLGIIKLS